MTDSMRRWAAKTTTLRASRGRLLPFSRAKRIQVSTMVHLDNIRSPGHRTRQSGMPSDFETNGGALSVRSEVESPSTNNSRALGAVENESYSSPPARKIKGSAASAFISPTSVAAFDPFGPPGGLVEPPFAAASQEDDDVDQTEQSEWWGVDIDLHSYITRGKWKKLCKILTTADEEDLRNAFCKVNEEGETPLHTAAWKAPSRVIFVMISVITMMPPTFKEDIMLSCDNEGNTPLHLACGNLSKSMESSIVKTMVNLEPEALEAANASGDTPLHLLVASRALQKTKDSDYSVEAAAEEAVSNLLERAPHLGTRANDNGATLLHIAIALGAYERVQAKLVELSPKAARKKDHNGLLPIHYVAAFGGTPWTIVKQIIRAYPQSILIQNKDGDTALHLLMSNAYKFLKKDMLLDRNTLKIAELLMGKGFKVYGSPVLIKNNDKLNPLHVAALFNTPPQLTKLVVSTPEGQEASADTTPTGSTPTHLLAEMKRGTYSMTNVEVLATKEACLTEDCKRRTPIIVAIKKKKVSKKLVKTLLQACPEAAKHTSPSGHLPLHHAVATKRAKESVVKALIRANPEGVTTASKKGNTPLHEAVKHKAPEEVVKRLIGRHREVLEMPNNDHELPIDLARAHGVSKKTLNLLKSKKAAESMSVHSRFSTKVSDV